jgi:hypothetical protein
MDVQDSVQVSTALVVATQDGVDMRFNSRELALDLDSFSQLHLAPAMASLISNIDADVLAGCTRATYNWATNTYPLLSVSSAIGSVSTMGDISSLTAPGNARTRMNQSLAPKGDRYIQVNSEVMARVVGGTAAYFNPSGAISEQFREGLVARTAMADYYENERVWSMPHVSSVLVSSWKLAGFITTLGVNSVAVSTTQQVREGMVFNLGGIYDVHPETKAQYATLKQFTVVSSVFAATTTLAFSPPIYISGPRQNVASIFTASSVEMSSRHISFAGTTTLSFPTGLMYHKDAFTFATAELPLMGASEKCVRRTYDGLSLRVWQDSDIRNDELLTRIDILYGYAAIRPAWACRLIGTGS